MPVSSPPEPQLPAANRSEASEAAELRDARKRIRLLELQVDVAPRGVSLAGESTGVGRGVYRGG